MKLFMKFTRIFIPAFMVLITSCSSNKPPLPEGWRTLNKYEIEKTWRDVDDNKYLAVKGDFNGDGFMDEARILLSEKGSGLALFSFMKQADNTYNILLLNEMDDESLIHAMGIRKVEPGLYKTACGKGYWECEPGEPPEILIKNDAIDLFKVESANSFFYWDEHSKTFKRIWISD